MHTEPTRRGASKCTDTWDRCRRCRCSAHRAGVRMCRRAAVPAANKGLPAPVREDFTVGPVCIQTLAVGEELPLGDVSRVMVGYGDAPFLLRHAAQMCGDL